MKKNPTEILRDFLNSEEGKKSLIEFGEKLKLEEDIKNHQIDRFHSKIESSDDFSLFVENVINKYKSKKYRDFWYSKGFEPREDLFFFLFEYAQKYGEEVNTKEEFEKYGNMFTGGLFKIHGYYFNLMHGQGSCVIINKKN